MNFEHLHKWPRLRAAISAKVVIVLAIITSGTGFLVYEWHHAHPAKTHHSGGGGHHHKGHGSKSEAD